MPTITLPDQARLDFDAPVTLADIAARIGSGLAKAALAGKIDGRLVDLDTLVTTDAAIELITAKSPEGLDILRHSASHLMAHAVKQLFPATQVTIGPVITDGFYYDFACSHPFTPEDLQNIEERMKALSAQAIPVKRIVMARDAAIDLFREMGEDYKVEIITDLPSDQEISLYQQGDFIDLCRGPHVPDTGKIKVFRLMRVSGAFWRGDSRNEMLQRIYGTAWSDKQQMQDYLDRLAEAEKRDHRKLGQQLDLFHFHEAAPGSVFWHPKGWTLFQQLINYMRTCQNNNGYEEINTPDLMDRSLWETSGHWFNFRANMFTTQTEDERVFALKPMNCPGGMLLYSLGIKSYRDLPIRWAEFGKVHRYEPSGSLHGLMRVRHFTQDDAHIFCTEEQIEEECRTVVKLIMDIYRDFGFDHVAIKLSTRPDNRLGTDEIWDKLEASLSMALDHMGLDYATNPGEGAFYGPKLEFVLRDAIGRDWQCGTLQVDMNLPERFDIHYIAQNGERRRPVMLHRALFGSLERFCGILIEHYAGNLPAWLSPVQVAVLNITDRQADYVQEICKKLKNLQIRVISDLRNEKISYKIREHSLQRIPYLLIAGDREEATRTITVRKQSGKNLGTMPLEAFVAALTAEIDSFGKTITLED